MTRPQPRFFERATQAGWLEMAQDHNVPAWLRVHALARAHHHYYSTLVRFEPGEMSHLLTVVNRQTGEVGPMHPANLRRAIKAAMDRGYLLEGSTVLALAIPSRFILTDQSHRKSDVTGPGSKRVRSDSETSQI